MSNEPVAWMNSLVKWDIAVEQDITHDIPLYTHPAKHLSLQKVDGELVAVTYTDDEHRIIEVLWEKPPAKTLTDEEIYEVWWQTDVASDYYKETKEFGIDFARAILRKAQEK